jgi:hypothetical protein
MISLLVLEFFTASRDYVSWEGKKLHWERVRSLRKKRLPLLTLIKA